MSENVSRSLEYFKSLSKTTSEEEGIFINNIYKEIQSYVKEGWRFNDISNLVVSLIEENKRFIFHITDAIVEAYTDIKRYAYIRQLVSDLVQNNPPEKVFYIVVATVQI